MRQRTRITFLVLTAALALGAAVSTASANRLEISEQRILALFKELTFEQSGGGIQVVCDVNIEGSFHSRTISKVSGQLIGYITEAIIHHPCTRNEAWVLNGVEVLPSGRTTINTLPWHVRFDHFEGTLPNITIIDLQLIGAGFLIEALNFSCLFKSSAARPMVGLAILETEGVRHQRGQVTGLRAKEEFRIPLFEGSRLLCPSEGVLRGTGTVGTQSSWSLVFIRLVR